MYRTSFGVPMLVCMLLTLGIGGPVALHAEDARDVLTNSTIVEMKQLGFADDVIIEKIKASPGEYDTSLAALKELKAAGISDAVLAEMMRATGAEKPAGDPNDPLSAHDPGIYLYREGGDGSRMIELEPTVSMQTKTGGIWKSAFSYGVAKVKARAIIEGLHAEFKIADPRPTFYFYFGEESDKFGGISPKEFALVEMKMRENKGWREVVVGTFNIAGGKAGVLDKFAVEFNTEEVGPGIWKVVPANDLPPGDYCFYYGGGGVPGPVGAAFSAAGGGVKIFQFCTHEP